MSRNRRISALAATAIAAAAIVWWQTRAAGEVPLADIAHIHGIAVDPTDSARLILATHHGLYRASPGKDTAEPVSASRDDFMGFTPHPGEAEVFFASGHPAGGGNLGVIVSRDGGKNWEKLGDGVGGPVDFHALDVSAADPRRLFGLYGSVQVSRDGGVRWEAAGAPQADVFDLAASATDADTVYAATRNGVMVSRDGAKTWRQAGGALQPATMVEAAADGTVYAFVAGVGFVAAQEPALAWETRSGGFGERLILHLAVDPNDASRLFAATADGDILASTDGGRNWQSAVRPSRS